MSHVLSWGCICFNPDVTKADSNSWFLILWILLTWVTQTSHGKCLFVCVLFYNKAISKYLRCAMLLACTVYIELIVGRLNLVGSVNHDQTSGYMRKLVFRVSDQVTHKPGCTATKNRQRLDCFGSIRP